MKCVPKSYAFETQFFLLTTSENISIFNPFIRDLMVKLIKLERGGKLMSDKNKIQSKKKNKESYMISGFIGAAIGAVFGLVSYVKNWI